MSVELTIVGLLLKTLRDDPTASQLKLLNERVHRLAYGFCLDGASALEDAVGQKDPVEREHLVSLALEYFRQGFSRNEVPWASLCAESVALCYQALGKTQDAQRWMLRAWSRFISDREAEYKSINAQTRSTASNVLKDTRQALSLKSFQVASRGLKNRTIGRHRPIFELFEARGWADEQVQNVFLLELQARRLIRLFPSMNIEQPNIRFWFPAEAQRPIFISLLKSSHLGYITYDGVVGLCFDDSGAKLRSLGLRPSDLRLP